jgi:CRISPR/Cas system-associated exonuclease Cas4 (RecB family)
MVEDWLNPAVHFSGRDDIQAEKYFYPLIERQMQIDPDHKSWLKSTASDGVLTEARALRHVRECFSKALEFLDEVDVWEVEYDASGRLPGLSVPIKAYVDIIGEHKKHGPVILDWKTGKQKPKDSFQLETYKALLMQNAGWNLYDFTGLWAMLHPEASKARPVSLDHVDPAEVGAKYQAVYEKMQAKLYPTKYSKYNCGMCFQQDNCIMKSGPTRRAKYYDRAAEEGFPF